MNRRPTLASPGGGKRMGEEGSALRTTRSCIRELKPSCQARLASHSHVERYGLGAQPETFVEADRAAVLAIGTDRHPARISVLCPGQERLDKSSARTCSPRPR